MVQLSLIIGAATFAGLAAAAGTAWKSNIKNVVVLVEENRSYDTILGGLTYNSKLNNFIQLSSSFCNPVNTTNSSQGTICAAESALNVDPQDPNHSISGVNMQLFGTFHPNETLVAKYPTTPGKYQTMNGFVYEHAIAYKTTTSSKLHEVIDYYTPAHIPVMNSLAENFVSFSQWFAAVPGPTNPNRAYLTSGTSAGHGKNDAAFGVYGLTQKSIFQQLSENNITWINYQNSTTGAGLGFNPDADFYAWTKSSGASTTNVKGLNQFYTDAAAGKLPQFTYINPECCSYQSFHPASSISNGEKFVKGIYQALRSSPQWNNTLFILTFDEHGGFADHVPPLVGTLGVPAGDSITYTETAPDGNPITFKFDRLGVRVPTFLISPWVASGAVEGVGSNNGNTYTHTSILNFLSELWNLTPLTPRVSWSSTFEHLILDTPRTNVIANLPNPVEY
ncbi:extracellular phospholipase C [Bombardia bombarda]|uniref:Extracellular phospholipase C n=1 Tax=Bombardia bombarda TaxID=252184 RepID=A0AA39WUL5_9PEZI|nr:extracellular phospholipase C [Bombardia bombarda]